MAEYTIDEFFEKVKEDCSHRERIPFLLLAVTFPHGPDRPRYHAVFPEPIPPDEVIETLELVVAQLKRRNVSNN